MRNAVLILASHCPYSAGFAFACRFIPGCALVFFRGGLKQKGPKLAHK
jgi:hypothetical protein